MSRKFIITVVLILFLLPFVSWYYLQSGLDWRKEAQDMMSGTTPFPALNITMMDGKVLTNDSIENKVTLVSFSPCSTSNTDQADVLNELYNQFKDTGKANFIIFDTCDVKSSSSQNTQPGWYTIACPNAVELCHTLIADWPKEKLFALVDRKGIIRSYYGIATKDEKRVLVEHMSLLLPRDRQEKVELKRGENK